MINSIYKIIVVLVFGGVFAACGNWLDVKPKKLVEEEDLFSSENGFKEVLTGIYLNLGNRDLYGENLTYGFMDILGQYYDVDNDGNSKYQDLLYYTFPSSRTEEYTESFWKGMYNQIANINNLLLWLEKNREVLTTPGYYEIIKGEALGLRAFLHFDLLRLYGPIYSENKDAKSIVYRTEFNTNNQGLLSAEKVIGLIIEDLKQAETLLANDPLYFDFPKVRTDEDQLSNDPFLRYRYHRMNLYGVKALAARVHLYGNNKTEAAKYAKEVIDSDLFKFVTDNSVDRVYSTELVFSIYVPEFADQVATCFTHNGYYHISSTKFLDDMFDVTVDGKNDIRYRAYSTDMNGVYPGKYLQEGMWYSTEGTIPLIRLPEMYYILAECSEDYEESAQWLNKVRENRGIDQVSYNDAASKLKNIEKEYRKDLFGEGQLFFFYKRNFYTSFLHCPVKTLNEKNYIFSLPENEVIFGITE